MLETYLFITPWGDECFNCEKETIRYFKQAAEKVDLKIIPVLNMNIVLNYINHNNLDRKDYNQLFHQMYLMILDYKAACYQGLRSGKNFLMLMQESIIEKEIPYSDELAIDMAKKAELDMEMFESDRQSVMVQDEFKSDQKLAHEMGAEELPAAVIFNLKDEDYGLLMDHYDYETLASVCKLDIDSSKNTEKWSSPKSL